MSIQCDLIIYGTVSLHRNVADEPLCEWTSSCNMNPCHREVSLNFDANILRTRLRKTHDVVTRNLDIRLASIMKDKLRAARTE